MSSRANSGAKIRVRTGAMFSMTLCFASTSQEATTAAPTAPHGTIQCWRYGSILMPIASKMPTDRAMSTPPPSAMST
ncbi:MAG: hypothetical protein MUE61_13860 [Vicinamibacterales bacterium]|nr:hypothetical protein [Vicinamibacterales bacterium]